MSRYVFQLPSFKDTILVDIDEAITHFNPVDSEIRTAMRLIPGADDLSWGVSVYPSGAVKFGTNHHRHLGVFVVVSKTNVHVHADISLLNTPYKRSFSHLFEQHIDFGFGTYVSHQHLLASGACQDGKFTIKCEVSITVNADNTVLKHTVSPLNPILPFEFVELAGHSSSDADFLVDDQLLKVHRGYLSMMSPTFQSIFSQSELGIVNIDDFTYETVKTAVDYLYGHEIADKTDSKIIDALRFMKKYDVITAVKKLESWIIENLAEHNFPTIALYAFEDGSESLRSECLKFFAENSAKVVNHPNFRALNSDVVFPILQHVTAPKP